MIRWIPTLALLALFIPCDDGRPIPDLTGVLFDQFNRLTAKPSLWTPVYQFLSVACAMTVPRFTRPLRR